uniref:Acyl-CoA dehydrogenase n=1 Tax=Acrobeloides nanus TaxID=290746 RepID=A0A914DKF7_9BILA
MKISMKTTSSLPYAHAKLGGFIQEAPLLHNPFTDDPILERVLRRWMPQNIYSKVSEDLTKFGNRIVTEIDSLGRECELHQPKLEQYDAWGNREDKLILTPEWTKLKRVAAEEGLLSIGYDPNIDPTWRRLYQFSKLYLFSPSAGMVTCPLAAADGAAKTIKALKLDEYFPEVAEAFRRLTSRNQGDAWTSGQWMTEKRGGSDVGSGTDTRAVHVQGNKYLLYGYKWFTSTIDSEMTFTLARPVDTNENIIEGTKGLSLFYLELRNNKTGKLNGVQMVRLKNKLGTRQLPTAELLLDGAEAIKVSDDGKGIASISNMLNITRIHNAVASIGFMRRAVSLARDYATRRVVFGRKQADWPLHLATIGKLEVEVRACTLLMLEATRLLGIQESGHATKTEQANLRLITPILKLYTGKQCIPLISEAIECFGGQGYIEDTGLPTLLRDAQITPIWEGTTNVLSLDVLRVLEKDNIVQAFHEHINDILNQNKTRDCPLLKECEEKIKQALANLTNILKTLSSSDASLSGGLNMARGAREIAFAFARIYSGALLVAHAGSPTILTQSDKETAYRYCVEKEPIDLNSEIFSEKRNAKDRAIVYENFKEFPSKL